MATSGLYGSSPTGAVVAAPGSETSGLYGSSPTGATVASPGSETSGLYGNGVNFGGTYFEWFIFIQSETQPATPTGGSWNFSTNVGTPPSGWSTTPPANPTLRVWGSVALVNSANSASLTWSEPGQFAYAQGLPVLSGADIPLSSDGSNNQLYVQTGSIPQTIWLKESGTWTRLTGSTLYVDLVNNQTILGTKTFSSQIQGSVSGTSSNVTGVVAIGNGGTGQVTANSALNALLPSQATNASKVLTTDGSNTSWQVVAGTGTVTSVNVSGGTTGLTTSGGPVTVSGTITLGGTLGTANGGTGSTSTTYANLASNVYGVLPVNNGGTGVTTSTGSGSNVLSTNASLSSPTISNYEAFTPSAAPTYAEGLVWYDSASYALAYYNNTTNNAIHIGQELQQQVRNSTGSTITKGQVVYISGATGQIGNIVLAQANAYNSSQVIGVANQDIPNNTNGWIVTQGTVTNINTAGFTAGAQIYLSATTAGALTQTEPSTPNYAVHMGVCLYSNTNNGKIYINPINKSIDTGYVIGQIAVAQGGTGTATPSLVAGTNVSITGTWPNQTINSSNPGGTVTSVNASGGTTGLTFTGGPVTSSGTLTLGGTLAVASGGTGVTTSTGSGSVVLSISPTLVTPLLGTPTSVTLTNATGLPLTTGVTGTLPIANGGTGQTTQATAITALTGTQTSGYYLRSNGTNSVLSAIQAADVPTLNQNTTGTAANITATSNSTLTTLSALSLPTSQLTGTLGIGNGGTGQTTANAAFNALAPTQVGNSGKFLTTDGTNTSWATNPLGTVTSVAATVPSFLSITGSPITTSGTLAIGLSGTALPTTSGGTGLTSFTANQVFYASSTSAFAQSANFAFNGTTVTIANDALINNLNIGIGSSNTFGTIVGYQSLQSNISGTSNSAFGYQTLKANTSGSLSTAIGYLSLKSNTTGSDNTALGQQALSSNTTASSSTAVGSNAAWSSTTASNLTAVGYSTLFNNNGNSHTAIGSSALYSNTSGVNNTVLGYRSGYSITTGSKNVIVGSYEGLAAPISQTGSNYIIFSDGDANVRGYFDGSGNLNVPSLTASKVVFTDASKNLTSTGTVSVVQGGTGTSTPALVAGTNISITGTWPNQTISSTNPGGTVTSVSGTGTVNGLTLTGTVTTSGSLTLGGTLSGIANSALTNSSITIGGTTIALGGSSNALANDITIYGLTVGRGAGAMSTNTALGNGVLSSNTTGLAGVGVGYLALSANTTGSFNVAIGRNSLIANTTADGNTALGDLTLTSNTTGASNVAVGRQALQANTTASNNTAVGYQAGYSNTTGTLNVFVGTQAGYSSSTSNSLIFIGNQAGYFQTGGSSLAIGYRSQYGASGISTGNYNVSIGENSLLSLTSGSYNTALGVQALNSNTTASYNTAVGWQAGQANTTGLITAVGSQALNQNTTGVNNVAVGGYTSGTNYAALTFNTTGSNNTAIGNGALQANTTASSNTAVGYQAGYSNTTGTEQTFIGQKAGLSNTTGNYNIAIGSSAYRTATTGSDNVTVGSGAQQNGLVGSANTAIGNIALQANAGSNNSAVGFSALLANTTGNNNTALGRDALISNTTASNNTAVGYQALYNNTGNTNVAVGYQAGYSNTSNGAGIFIGGQAGYASTGTYNTFVGHQAGVNVTTGGNNLFIGSFVSGVGGVGSQITTGSKNTIIGSYNGNQGGLDIRTASNYIVLSDGDGNIGISARYISLNTIDIQPRQLNHAVAYIGESGSISNASSAIINVNGYGGDGSGGFIFVTTAASDGSSGYDSTYLIPHSHGSAYNTYGSSLFYTSVNSITIVNAGGIVTITNASGKTIKYQIRYLNFGSKNITLA